MSPHPLVSVVTPVYNGGAYLKECIESVLGQSYPDLEYVILDNASTDDTRGIAESYRRRDRRIRLFSNDATVPFVENWNRALARISGESIYCKILHADDLIYADCLRKMIALPERDPSIGIVGSLRLRGDRIECRGLPESRHMFSGVEVARMFLRRELFGFAPTSGLVRSDLVRERRQFYPTKYLHADLAAYFDLLDHTNFGFVHEVLAFSRTHANSLTSTMAERKRTLLREWPFLLQEYGPRYFAPDELAALEKTFMRHYYRVLIRSLVTRRTGEFMAYHLAGLKEAQRSPTVFDLGLAVGAELAASMRQPAKLYRHLRDAIADR